MLGVDDDPMAASLRRPPSSARGAVTVAVLLFAIAAGLGYYASTLWLQNDEARTALASVRRQNEQRGTKVVALEAQRDQRDELIKQANAKLFELNTALASAQTRLDELDEERDQIEAQLAEFRQLTRQFQRMIDSGRLTVAFRRGRMIVELPAQVLFPSGSEQLTDEGRKSLGDVAKILRTMRSRRFIVAGHTDDVPVANERFASNWSLSAARAVEVTSALIRGGLRPEQLVAAGYSEYDPVARNASAAGRKKNRRIEIILEPRLAPLPGSTRKKAPKQSPGR
jgi:chemotaxis protein MotB